MCRKGNSEDKGIDTSLKIKLWIPKGQRERVALSGDVWKLGSSLVALIYSLNRRRLS